MYEKNFIIKDWRNIDLSFGLVYPNRYQLGLSSYTIRLLYFLINSNKKIACERIFLPKITKFPAAKDNSSENQLRSLENRVLPIDFDILGFSLHFENDFKNVLWILEKSGIPINYEERRESLINKKHDYPLVIAGGPAVTSNPLPLSKIFDIFFLGDSEPNIIKFCINYIKYKLENFEFPQFLDEVKKIEGIFIPSINNVTKRAVLNNLDDSPIPVFQLLSKTIHQKKVFEENFLLEVNRGCPYQCKFCISSFHNFPFRNRSFESIVNAIEEGITNSKFEKISLIGSCVSSHPKFYEICRYILDKRLKFSVPSIRLDHLTPKIIKILEEGEIKTITIAPETGSESLRYELGKKIPDEKIFEVLKLLKHSKIKNVKFYFLVGLPDENKEDIDNIINLLRKIDEFGFEKGALRINVNPFVPKFNTPYESKVYYYLSENLKKIQLIFQTLERELKNLASIKLKFQNFKDLVNKARLQTLISLGDQNVAEVLSNYYLNGANMGALRRAEKELDFSIDEYFKRIQMGYKPWPLQNIKIKKKKNN